MLYDKPLYLEKVNNQMKNLTIAIFTSAFILANFSLNILSASEQIQSVSVQVLGSGGPYPNDGRASASYLIWVDGKAKVMIDTGFGSSLNFEKSGANFLDVDAILFTHFHEDHSSEFPAYIKASTIIDRENDLAVFGPAGNDVMGSTTEFVNGLYDSNNGIFRFTMKGAKYNQASPIQGGRRATRDIQFKLNVTDVELDKNKIQLFKLSDTITLSAIQTQHSTLPAIAWRVDVGDKSATFSGDMTNRFNTLAKLAKDSDILIAHNSMLEPPEMGVYFSGHMQPSQIGRAAADANVKKLVLSHRSIRVIAKDPESEEVIKKIYSGPLFLANDLDEYPL